MSDEKQKYEVEKRGTESQELVPYNPNFDRFMDWLENLRDETVPKIISKISEDRESEREQRDKDRRVKENNSKRSFIFLMTILSMFFVMWMAAFFSGESETAKDILLVLIGAGLGFGLSSAVNG